MILIITKQIYFFLGGMQFQSNILMSVLMSLLSIVEYSDALVRIVVDSKSEKLSVWTEVNLACSCFVNDPVSRLCSSVCGFESL